MTKTNTDTSDFTLYPNIYCALDTTDMDHAADLARAMQSCGCGIKLGLEFFNANGPDGIARIKDRYPDLSLFIDLKYHDIPNTVAGAVRAISKLEPDYINVHALGGADMMKAAKDAIKSDKTKLLAVTLLTSMSDKDAQDIGLPHAIADHVTALARLTDKAGLDGVVCSAAELLQLTPELRDDFIYMVPGIRPAGSATDDQQRVMTPYMALKNGATHLVIGRPITQHSNPEQAAREIMATLQG